MNAEIVSLTEEHVEALAPRARLHDEEGVRRAFGIDAAAMLRQSAAHSVKAWAGTIDGEPICAFGLHVVMPFALEATPWLITTPEVDRHRVTFWRHCRPALALMLARYPTLIAQCQEDFAASRVWLRRLGFEELPTRHETGGVKRAAPGVAFVPYVLRSA